MVNAFVAVAVTVTEPPKLTEDPFIVIALLFSAEFGIDVRVFVAPEIEAPTNVAIVPPKDTVVEPIVIELFVRPALGIVATAVKGLVPLPTR
jgi:hypothetical protein